MEHIKLAKVQNHNEIKMNALTELKQLTGVTEIIKEIENTRYYNMGETIAYQVHFKDGSTKRIKNKYGGILIDTLGKMANVTVYRVSEKGNQQSRLLGWIIRPN